MTDMMEVVDLIAGEAASVVEAGKKKSISKQAGDKAPVVGTPTGVSASMNVSTEVSPSSPPQKVYPQVELARNRVIDGVRNKKTDEALARDILRGGGVLVKDQRIEFWYDPSIPFEKQGIEEPQPGIASFVTAVVVDEASSSGTVTPVGPPEKKEAAPKKAQAKKKNSPASSSDTASAKWIRGTVLSSNKSKYTVTIELDSPMAQKSKATGKPIRILVVQAKAARWKLVEYIEAIYEGRVYQPRVDQKPSTPCESVSEAFKCEIVFSDLDCVQTDLAETKKEFNRSRRADASMKRIYSFKYSVPANEQAEMDELRKTEREGLSNMNKEVKAKTDEINARVASQVSELEIRRSAELEPLEAKYQATKKDVDLERDEKVAGLEALEGRTSGTGMSLRVQKKAIDDHHRARWVKEVVPLEKKLGDIDSQFSKTRRMIEAAGRDEIDTIIQRKDDYVAAVKARQQALRDKWKKLAEDDVNAMKMSQNIRIEKEWILIRKALSVYLTAEATKRRQVPDGLVKGLDIACTVCRVIPAFQCQQNRCDECWKFSIYEDKIEELELRVPWSNNRTSAEFTPYHVFYHERSRQIRSEKPNIEPALISQQLKEEWKRLADTAKDSYERKRQDLLLELMDHIEEEEEVAVPPSSSMGDLSSSLMGTSSVPIKRSINEVLENDGSESESDEACMKCLTLKHPGKLLQCDRTEGEAVSQDDDRICGGMLHTYCCKPPLESVPPGDWYCSWLCQWVQSHKPAVTIGRKKIGGKPTLSIHARKRASITDTVVIADDDVAGPISAGGSTVKADVAVAKRNRLEFILAQWGVIEYFLGDTAEKAKASFEAKLESLDAQLLGIDTSAIQLRPKIESAGVPFPIDTTPGYVDAEMRPYQLEGLSWYIDQHDKGANSIMGDEMGLGKTLQTLSFLATLQHYTPFFSPFLVVCPLSVLPNWIAEAKRWTPQLNVVGLYGPQAERERIKQTLAGNDGKSGLHLMVTTYEILLTEITWLRSQFYFRYFVLDEAQKIKNIDAQITQACRQIRSVYRVLLTGTPLQNNMKELWALLNFLYPEVFTASGSMARFASAYDSSTTSDDTSTTMIRDDSLMKECRKLLEPIMLRRLKQNVLAAHLPPKTEIVLSAPMSPQQQYHYRQVLKTVTGMVRNVGYKNVSSLLWQLWKCCLHPFLFDSESAGSHEVDSRIVWMSGKMCLLDGLLAKLFEDKSKCLVYSQYTSMLDIIEEYCQWRGWKYLRLDGSTSLARRRFYMHQFNEPVTAEKPFDQHYFVFLVSTKAGGVGVNLQAANSVILYDSSWNPFVDAQAEDRAHRMGQKKEVTIYRLITSGTCEERIRFFAQQKLKMKQFVLNEDESGSVVETDLADEATDVAKIYSADQLKDIIEYGQSEILEEGDSLVSESAEAGSKFYDACCESLDSQLAKARERLAGAPATTAGGHAPLSPVRRNICIRKFKDEDYTSTRIERTTEMDWLDMMEEANVVQRNRKATTVTIDTHERGLGKIQVSRWSIEQEQKEKEMMERDRARIDAKKIGGNKRVTEHDMNCLHCRESVLKQRVIVTTEIDEEGKEVKRRRIDTDSSGFQACPICPATMHLSCLRLAAFGADATVRASCPQHKCKICRRSASNAGGLLFRCVDCPIALCYDCIEKYSLSDHFQYLERENVRWERDLGFTAASTYEYMRCPQCKGNDVTN